jgi:glycosyltransferase involved in cell wall biosynthesis
MGEMSRVPKVSIAIASYNHAPFVAASLRSVLEQSFQDFEIVLTDDGSKDATVEEVRNIRDSRISATAFPRNVGASIALNASIQRSRGSYIAILNSDDVFLPGKLDRQVRFLDAHSEIGAVFGYPEFIDESGNRLASTDTFYADTFHVTNRTRAAWLRHFFFVGNALCHPSVLIRRRCYDTVGLYNPALAQIPDLDMWMRLLRHFDIHLIEEPIVGFRILKAGQNASAGRPDSIARVQWERLKVLSNYLDLDSDLLGKVFPELPEASTSPPVNWFLGQLACATGKPPYILFGLDLMYRLAADLDEPDLYREFIRYSGAYDIFDVLSKMPTRPQ